MNFTTTKTESQKRIDALTTALKSIDRSTKGAGECCDRLARRAKHLDSLTSPASDASALLTQANHNLSTTISLLRDAREKFDTVADCEPAIARLMRGAEEAIQMWKKSQDSVLKGGIGNGRAGRRRGSLTTGFMPNAEVGEDDDGVALNSANILSEQDVYAAADSMEIIRDAYSYFLERSFWRSTPSALGGLERVHKLGVDAMCLLINSHLTAAGPAVRMKRIMTGTEKGNKSAQSKEKAHETRRRLTAALQNRDLLKSVGEYEEFLPLDTRAVRELRAVFECLGSEGCYLGPESNRPSYSPVEIPNNKVTRTEKVGSGCYSNLTKRPLKTGFPHLDAYGEARKAIAFSSMDGYYRQLRTERKRRDVTRRTSMSSGPSTVRVGGEPSDVDGAARDAVRCLEHSMIIVAGEKSIYRCVISPMSSQSRDDGSISRECKKALIDSYSHVVSAIVDRTMDIIEGCYFKEGGLGVSTSSGNPETGDPPVGVRSAASAAAGGFRLLDGVRMLGPSLAKLCELSDSKSDDINNAGSIAASLCISIHRTSVKNTARTLENVAKAIQNTSIDSIDARVAAISSDVVRAIRLLFPFASAYKTVTKRRALPWDPKIGDDASDIDELLRFIINRLLSAFQKKVLSSDFNQTEFSAMGPFFMINNCYYLQEHLGPGCVKNSVDKDEQCVLDKPWFVDKIGKIFEAEKAKYLSHWEVLNRHLTAVDKKDLTYQKQSKKDGQLLTLESGRLIKTRFSGFNEDFEKTYADHKMLPVNDQKLREILQNDVRRVFAPRYTRFFEQYSKIQFSKKNQDDYLKYPPSTINNMLNDLYETL